MEKSYEINLEIVFTEKYNYGCYMINPRIYLEHEAFRSRSVYIPDKPVNLETG